MTNNIENNEIIRHITDIENTQKLCLSLLKTPHYSKMGSEGIFAIVSKAKSLGMDLMEALNGGLYYVQGKVGMPAETMASLIRQKGHSIVKDPKSNHEVCILHGRRGDNGDTWTISFSMEDAKRAGLAKNMYDKYPSTMLYCRALSFLARQLFPDIIRGAGYTYDELKEISANSSNVMVSEEKVEFISSEQAAELRKIFLQCDPLYVEQVMIHLKNSSTEIDQLEDIPVTLFDRIMNAALKKQLEYQSVRSAKEESYQVEPND
jgi:hypothetical protein